MSDFLNKETKQGRRSIVVLIIIAYWVVFWIVPSVFLNVFYNFFNVLGRLLNYILNTGLEGFVYYFMVIAPLISFIIFIFLKNKVGVVERYNFKFFLLTIIIPYIYIILFFIYAVSQIEFGNSWI